LQPFVGNPVSSRELVDRHGDHWSTSRFSPLDELARDAYAAAGIELKPDRCASRFGDIFDRRR
jgi:hypothetical protein